MQDIKRPHRRHDYTAERISATGHVASSESVKLHGLATKLAPKKALLSLVILAAIAAVAALASGGHSKTPTAPVAPKPSTQQTQSTQLKVPAQVQTTPTPAPAAAAKPNNSATIYPTDLPAGFRINNDLQNLGQGVTSYSISDGANKYTVLQQPIPANFSQSAFAKGVTDAEELNVPLGTVVIGVSSSELLASIQTSDGRWILIEADGASLRPQLEVIVKSL